jgi:hypothetical protein
VTAHVGDALLEWVSAAASGSITDLLRKIDWAATMHGPLLRYGAAGRWIADASALGFLEADWSGGAWAATPTVVTRLPGPDGYAVITGARSAASRTTIAARADESGLELIEAQSPTRDGDLPSPATFLVEHGGQDLEKFSGAVNALWVPCFAYQAAARLPRLVLGPDGAGPADSTDVEAYDFRQGEYLHAQSRRQDGLYRFRQADHKRAHRIRLGAEWFKTTHEVGVFLEGRRLGLASPLGWRSDPGPRYTWSGTLFVDRAFPLPALHRRVAVMCTGLGPRYGGGHSQTIIYRNIPLSIGRAIAQSLGFPLTTR